MAIPPIPRASASTEPASAMMSGVEKYRLNRFRHFDQAWVNRREQRLIAQLLEAWHVPGGTLLDIPCGYGRLGPVYSCFGITATGVDVYHDVVQLMLANHMPCESKRACALPFLIYRLLTIRLTLSSAFVFCIVATLMRNGSVYWGN